MASRIVLEAVASAKQYLSYKYNEKDLSAIMLEIQTIAGLTKKHLEFEVPKERIGYNDLQKKLANLNEKEIDRKEKGVYYTPTDVVKFIVTNSIKSAYGKLHPNNLHVMDLNGIPYKSFCLTKRVYDPTCGAGEFLLSALEIKFDLMDMHRQSIGKISVQRIIKTIFGNDINLDSIIISKLRLFLCALKRYGISKTKGLSKFLNENFTTLDFVTNNPNTQLFDIIVGNPPYVEDSKSNLNPKTKYGNIYGNVLENSALNLADKGAMGFVIPLSYVATPRMKTLRQALLNVVKEQYILSYADRPDCLFTSVHQKLCIIFGKKRNTVETSIYTDSYKYWYNAERDILFTNATAVKNTVTEEDYIPKVGSKLDISIYKKVTGRRNRLSDLFIEEGHPIYLNMRAAFWIKAFITEHNGSEYKRLFCNDDGNKNFCMCLLNSSLFWWYWICISDCWHITQKELNGFSVPELNDFAQVNLLAQKLENKLEQTKEYVGTKQTEYEYKHKNCTDEIHEIDDYINNLYGLTEQESLYIKDFAFRYRIGGGAEDEGN
ncbi:MAG: N-6 DNA methylase [Oscillospiraceae bacterium]|nr:N-6 DNA methylase [Oscillospiraceae bacterium]